MQTARAVTVAVYGNRAYEDALLELNDCVQAQGFCPLASAALLAEHSMCRQVAAGRPNAQDAQRLPPLPGRFWQSWPQQTARPCLR